MTDEMNETPEQPKSKRVVGNKYLLPIAGVMEQEGYTEMIDFLEQMCSDSVMPACCTAGCEVEPDGYCEHGCPSVALAAGLI